MKRELLAVLLMVLSISLVPINVKGKKTYELDYWTYLYDWIEADELDLVTWEFTSTGNSVELYLMDSAEFQSYQLWSSIERLHQIGERLTGYAHEGSGNFKPTHADTWYFIFMNAGHANATAIIEYEINKIAQFYVIVPTIIIAVIVITALIAFYFYSERKKKESPSSRVQTTTASFPQQAVRSQVGLEYEFCPECGTKKQDNLLFCTKCGFDFRDL